VSEATLLKHTLQTSEAAHLGAVDDTKYGTECAGVLRLLRAGTSRHGENFIE
jgi:hypothetical protein